MHKSMRAETPRSVKLMEVIEVKALRGKGTSEDIARIVVQYWSKDGKLLAEKDEYKESL